MANYAGKMFRFVFLLGLAALIFNGFSLEIGYRPLGTLTSSKLSSGV
jgi:hypothetical protein